MRFPTYLFLLVVLMVPLTIAPAVYGQNAAEGFELIDAQQRGAFTTGEARSTLSAEHGVLKLDYTVPAGTFAGIWTSGFEKYPDGRKPDVVKVRIIAKAGPSPAHLAPALELKGANGIQRIPLDPKGTVTESQVDWAAIGELKEAVVSVTRTGDGATLSGSLSFEVSFERLPLLRKICLSPLARMGSVLLLGIAAFGLASLLGEFRKASRQVRRSALEPGWGRRLFRDFVLGSSVVFLIIIVFGIYQLGSRNPLDTGWVFALLATAGALLGEWMKYGLTGKHLTPGEAFQNVSVTGLFSAASSSLVVLQAPGNWSDTLLLSSLVAAVGTFLYHAVNLYCLSSSAKHSSGVFGAMIGGIPFLTGSLLLLEPSGMQAGWPAFLRPLSATLVIWLFNEGVANALSAAVRRRLIPGFRMHLLLSACAAAATAAPWMADFGSGSAVSSLPGLPRLLVVVLATALSQAALWAEVFLITGMILDAVGQKSPSWKSSGHALTGARKGMVFGGIFMALVYGSGMLVRTDGLLTLVIAHPSVALMLIGALTFPLAKTLIETFDGTQGFFRRLVRSYRVPVFFLRGAAIGLGLGYALGHSTNRVVLGAALGLLASAGISVLRDLVQQQLRRGRLQTWRLYLVHGVIGSLIGAGLGFYFDAAQVSIVLNKIRQYLAIGQPPESYSSYLLLSKWGHVQLGAVSGGVRLLFSESLMGVLSWAIPAWLFAINGLLMSALFRRERTPVARLFTRQGLLQVGESTVHVFRWGLWMAPVIFTFIRPMADPTWYNQDGAIRTFIAGFKYLTSSPDAFHEWSLGVFIAILAYNSVRILVWLDHMGLRVATLVNLSFQGLDRLDRRLARFLGPSAATAQCIPDAVKRFATWAPLLIPFYLPRGSDWDYVWSRSESIQTAGLHSPPGFFSLPPSRGLMATGVAVIAATALFTITRLARERRSARRASEWKLANAVYETVVRKNGGMFSRVTAKNYDVSRRSYDLLDPAGRALFLVDSESEPESGDRSWPLIGRFVGQGGDPQIGNSDGTLLVRGSRNGIATAVEISLAGDDPAELWTVTIENRTQRRRQLKLVPYLEWVLNRPESDRGHTQYNRLYPEMEYVSGLHAVLAWHKQSKAMGVLAVDAQPEGFLTSRIDFIGRAQSIASPRVLQTLAFSSPADTGLHPTFDPIGSLLVGADLNPGESVRLRVLIGLTSTREESVDLIARHFDIPGTGNMSAPSRETSHSVRHGEILPGTPQPYSEFSSDGRRLIVHTPLTPRPYDHTMANALGHVMVVTNRGLHTTSNGNSQQNRITPDWADIVTREVPGEALYLYDTDDRQWYSPTYHPLNDPEAHYDAEFGVDGTATHRMRRGSIATELTTFVPPEDPSGIYRLTIHNLDSRPRHFRFAPYFQIVLADQPENAGPLKIRYDRKDCILYFENPRNAFRTGPAFVSTTAVADCVETRRGRFYGPARDVRHPSMLESGEPCGSVVDDDRPIAAFLTSIEVLPGSSATVAVVLGQADSCRKAEETALKYRDLESVDAALASTKKWWTSYIEKLQIDSGEKDLDPYVEWLKYQTLAERLWARRGFYQASGAYGFRDQLQDAVNLIWVDPLIARNQIMLHAAQQFTEGDVVHWFHRLQDGRIGFAARTYASDNPLWLPWATVEYLAMTGDYSLLDESVPYLEAEQPPVPLPEGKHGQGFVPHRSSKSDPVYRHCIKAIDLVLEKRMGTHRLPLIGTGDWNDGLDEIGSAGRGESVWLGFFLFYILKRMIPLMDGREDPGRIRYYKDRAMQLESALQCTWRNDRYLRAIHDDGTEIGENGSGVWEIDALTAAWAVMAGIDDRRARKMFDTAISTLERGNAILLGWPPLREDTKPYLGRSSWYPEGVRENGMYCHGVQWLVGAARILSRQCRSKGDGAGACSYAETAYRLWRKISALDHVTPDQIEIYGGQPNKQAADLVTSLDPGRMGWHGYTGAAGWMLRQCLEGVFGLRLEDNQMISPSDDKAADARTIAGVVRSVEGRLENESAEQSIQAP